MLVRAPIRLRTVESTGREYLKRVRQPLYLRTLKMDGYRPCLRIAPSIIVLRIVAEVGLSVEAARASIPSLALTAATSTV